MQPGPSGQVELLAVNGEAKSPGQDLNHGSAGCLMLGEFFAGVEAEHCDIHPVAPVYDLGDNGTGLDRHFAGGISDQRMGHSSIIARAKSTRHSRGGHVSASAPAPTDIRGQLKRGADKGIGADEARRSNATSARLPAMAFGQQSGPPASARQVQELLTLLKDAGHADFRDARGPMGFTQRQAAGKFTRDEAAAFIDRLQDAELDGDTPVAVPAWRLSAQEQIIRHVPAEKLAVELRRRGWTVIEP